MDYFKNPGKLFLLFISISLIGNIVGVIYFLKEDEAIVNYFNEKEQFEVQIKLFEEQNRVDQQKIDSLNALISKQEALMISLRADFMELEETEQKIGNRYVQKLHTINNANEHQLVQFFSNYFDHR